MMRTTHEQTTSQKLSSEYASILNRKCFNYNGIGYSIGKPKRNETFEEYYKTLGLFLSVNPDDWKLPTFHIFYTLRKPPDNLRVINKLEIKRSWFVRQIPSQNLKDLMMMYNICDGEPDPK